MAKSMIGRGVLRADAVVSYTDLITAATTETETLFSLPAGTVISDCFVDVVTPFSDTEGGITACTLAVGVSGDVDAFFNETPVIAGTATASTRYATEFQASAGYGNRVLSSATDIIGTFVANINFGDGADTVLDAGVLRVTVLYQVLPLA